MTSIKHMRELTVLRWLCYYADLTTTTALFIYPEENGATLYMETYEVPRMPAPCLNSFCYDPNDIDIRTGSRAEFP